METFIIVIRVIAWAYDWTSLNGRDPKINMKFLSMLYGKDRKTQVLMIERYMASPN
jgi:hypothetical protein